MPVKRRKTTVTRKAVSARRRATVTEKKKKDVAASYNRYKFYQGKQYTGLQVGRGLKWYYDKGKWKDAKITPDLWRIHYAVTKRRAGKAPKGSGAAVGTGYHWFIIAHQIVKKLNADDYSTELSGLKLKLGHKRAAKGTWSTGSTAQRKKLVEFLNDWIRQLETAAIPIAIGHEGKKYKGEAVPIAESCQEGFCTQFEISLNGENLGIVRRTKGGWKDEERLEKPILKELGRVLDEFYSQK